MIRSFGDKITQDVFRGVMSPGARKILNAAGKAAVHRKLDIINAAYEPKDLQVPPGNRFEKLKGKLAGFVSIRINDQFRIVFRFASGDATDVRIVDYH